MYCLFCKFLEPMTSIFCSSIVGFIYFLSLHPEGNVSVWRLPYNTVKCCFPFTDKDIKDQI